MIAVVNNCLLIKELADQMYSRHAVDPAVKSVADSLQQTYQVKLTNVLTLFIFLTVRKSFESA